MRATRTQQADELRGDPRTRGPEHTPDNEAEHRDTSIERDRAPVTLDDGEPHAAHEGNGHESPLVAGDDSRAAAAPRPGPDRGRAADRADRVSRSRAAPSEIAADPSEHSPGNVRSEPLSELWPDQAAQGLRDRWRELQLLFVDDPKAATEGADAVLGETIELLNGSLQSARADLAGWRDNRELDTEGLRMVVRRYRTVLDRVLAL
jgi:hypothetical protein